MLGPAGGLAAGALAWLLAIALPGALWSLALLPGRGLLATAVVGLGLGLAAVPVAAFALAWLLGTAVSLPLALAVSAAASVAAVAVRRPSLPARGDSGDGGAAALALALALLAAASYRGTAVGYWDTYVAVPALLVIDEPVELVDDIGVPVASPTLPGSLPGNLVDPASGIATRDQHLGAGVLASVHALLLGDLGFRVSFALWHALAAAAVYLAARGLFASAWLGIAAETLLGFNAYVLSIDVLNPNAVVMSLAAVLAVVLLGRPTGRQLALAGVLLGVIGGVRSESLLFVPAVLAASRPWTGRRLGILLASALLASAPFLAWNRYAFGSLLAHPSQHGGFEGWRPTFEHHLPLLGTRFAFNGLLNWPFSDALVRTPHFPLPTFLVLPLTLVRSLGVLISALVPLGLVHLWRERRDSALFLLLWSLPLLLALLPQENWDELKMTFLLPLYPSVVILALAGVRGFDARRFAAAALLLFLAVRLCATIDVPADPRWTERFPRTLERPGVELPQDLRSSQLFFHLPETPGEVESQRSRLTEANLLPDIRPLPAERVAGLRSALASELEPREPGARRRIVDVWRYIYG